MRLHPLRWLLKARDAFYAHLWLTAYRAQADLMQSAAGDLRIAWLLWDASEDVRVRDLAQTELLDMTGRVLLAAFSHEVKRLSSLARAFAGRLSTPGA